MHFSKTGSFYFAKTGNYHVAVTERKEYVNAMQILPVLCHAKISGFIRVKSSLGNSYGEEKDYVFSMDDRQEECIKIFSSYVQ